jgi:hypothetical protein
MLLKHAGRQSEDRSADLSFPCRFINVSEGTKRESRILRARRIVRVEDKAGGRALADVLAEPKDSTGYVDVKGVARFHAFECRRPRWHGLRDGTEHVHLDVLCGGVAPGELRVAEPDAAAMTGRDI